MLRTRMNWSGMEARGGKVVSIGSMHATAFAGARCVVIGTDFRADVVAFGLASIGFGVERLRKEALPKANLLHRDGMRPIVLVSAKGAKAVARDVRELSKAVPKAPILVVCHAGHALAQLSLREAGSDAWLPLSHDLDALCQQVGMLARRCAP